MKQILRDAIEGGWHSEYRDHKLKKAYKSMDYFAEKDKTLTPVPGYSYIICWLSRGGFRKHNGPGAIMLPWKGRGGWGEGAGRWFSLGQETVEDTEDD